MRAASGDRAPAWQTGLNGLIVVTDPHAVSRPWRLRSGCCAQRPRMSRQPDRSSCYVDLCVNGACGGIYLSVTGDARPEISPRRQLPSRPRPAQPSSRAARLRLSTPLWPSNCSDSLTAQARSGLDGWTAQGISPRARRRPRAARANNSPAGSPGAPAPEKPDSELFRTSVYHVADSAEASSTMRLRRRVLTRHGRRDE